MASTDGTGGAAANPAGTGPDPGAPEVAPAATAPTRSGAAAATDPAVLSARDPAREIVVGRRRGCCSARCTTR